MVSIQNVQRTFNTIYKFDSLFHCSQKDTKPHKIPLSTAAAGPILQPQWIEETFRTQSSNSIVD